MYSRMTAINTSRWRASIAGNYSKSTNRASDRRNPASVRRTRSAASVSSARARHAGPRGAAPPAESLAAVEPGLEPARGHAVGGAQAEHQALAELLPRRE